ncbi:MAG TPA: response regulator transcription factor [Chloroflexota bacterium]|nr:response regulator transcription factor [Chloroflexota bacterium]
MSGDKIAILLADDHTITREGTRRLIEAEGDLRVVGEAENGDEAVRLTRELRPDLVLLDISMPGRSGIDAAAEIRRVAPRVKILILTGYGNHAQYARALGQLGVHGYLAKSVSSRELLQTIRSVAIGQVLSRSTGAPALPDGEVVDLPTPRELDVLRLVAQGLKSQEIAGQLCTSERTVHFHLSNLFAKLHASSRTELVYLARQQGWIG